MSFFRISFGLKSSAFPIFGGWLCCVQLGCSLPFSKASIFGVINKKFKGLVI